MRKLSESENQQIIKSIIRKEITSAEILMEIYDHYVSYLQEFEEEEVFDKELWELDQKFTYAYCHKIQANFKNQMSKEVGKAQFEILKKYFCLSRGLYLLGILILLTLVSFQFNKGDELNIIMISPILLLAASHMMFTYRSFKKLKLIKKIFKEQSIEIVSSVGKPISERLFLPVILLQALLFVPRFFLNLEVTQMFLPQIAVIFTTIGIIYTLSLWEVWKIKSKAALI